MHFNAKHQLVSSLGGTLFRRVYTASCLGGYCSKYTETITENDAESIASLFANALCTKESRNRK